MTEPGTRMRTDSVAPNAAGYRPDIDGLRAVAVLSVVAFHISSRLMPGGFVGVDVFFVISGYLISNLLIGEMRGGSFSLSGFYERRIRRIFPALVFMAAATSLAAWFLIYPAPFKAYAASVVAAIFSYSNIYFWTTSSYFFGLSEHNPLLHTWSLGVEEQFYFAFPLLLFALHKWLPRHVVLVIAGLAAGSLVWASIGAFRSPAPTFYMPHTRAWELLAGALVALGAYPNLSTRWIRETTAAAGAVLVAGSVLLISNRIPFPGLATIPPCLGAALIIAAGRSGETMVGRALAVKPMVFVGLISYSLYLWHWPTIALQQSFFSTPEHNLLGKLVAVGPAFAMAIISWWFVERPFRRRGGRRVWVFAAAGLTLAATAAAAVAVVRLDGVPQRFPPEVVKITAFLDYPHEAQFRQGVCFLSNKQEFEQYQADFCLKRAPGKKTALLIGDSYAAYLYSGLAEELGGINLLQAGAIGCKPLLRPIPGQDLPSCLRMQTFIFQDYLLKHPVDLLIISANWRPGGMPLLGETLDWAKAHNVPVTLTGPVPEYDGPLPRLLALGLQRGDPAYATRNLVERGAKNDQVVADFAARKGVTYGSAYRAMCNAGQCLQVGPAGPPLQFDHAHATREGSRVIARGLRAQHVLDRVVAP